MNAYIVIHSKYSKPEASVSQTMSRDAQRPLSVYGIRGGTTRAKGASAPHPAKTPKNFYPKMQVFKRVFELTCE